MSTALATIDVNQYALIATPGAMDDLKEAIEENMGEGSGLSLKNLTRIKTPSGGNTVFQITTPEGIKNVDTLTGIILVQQPRRVYYSKPMGSGDDENNRPDCFSNDAKVGVGIRFAGDSMGQHNCSDCPLAAWGVNGEKPRCALRKQLFLLREGDMLPVVLDLPPTSLKQVDAYLASLAVSALTYYYAVTEIGCEQKPMQGKKGQFYTELTFKQVGVVDRPLRPQIKDFQKAVKAMVMQPTPEFSGNGTAAGTADVMGEMEDIEL